MIQDITHLLTDTMFTAILAHFDISPDGLIRHDGFCSFVYAGKQRERDVILKISHSGRLGIGALKDELLFVAEVAKTSAHVCAPLITSDAILAIPDDRGECFFAYLYELVDGTNLDNIDVDDDPDNALITAAGEALGSFHAASQRIDATRFAHRKSFTEQDYVQYRDILPADETDTLECFDRIMNEVNALPMGGSAFGLIHGDAHDGNFMVSEDRACLIDFDEVERGFYVSDVANLLESLTEREGMRTEAFVSSAFDAILDGYSRFMNLRDLDWSTMGLFMKFSWISDHCFVYRQYAEANTDGFQRRRERRRALFASDFEEDRFLHHFDYQGAVDRFLRNTNRTPRQPK